MAPSVQLEKVFGQGYTAQPASWNKRDLLTYAVGIGAKTSETQFVYELGTFPASFSYAVRSTLPLDPSFAAFPTYPVVLGFKGTDQDVINFAERIGGTNTFEGLPTFDPKRLVHASQSIEILKPLPLVSGPGWTIKRRLTSVRENKSGVILETESLLVDPHDSPYARLFSATFNLTGKITGKPFSHTIASPPQHASIPRVRAPDYVIQDQTLPEQALIYRLSGDYNTLHIDPRVGSDAGFGGVILHGLSSFGFAARAILKAVGDGNPSALRYFGVRFTAPVVPGDGLETSVWEVKKAPDGSTEVAFEVKNTRTEKVVLGGGFARVVKSERSRL